MNLAFVDVETTGRDPRRHRIWEFAFIVREDEADQEYLFQLGANLEHAEPDALRIGRYYQRSLVLNAADGEAVDCIDPAVDPAEYEWVASTPREVAREVATALDGAFVIINNPVFDIPFIDAFLASNGQCWTRHYQVADIKSVAAGFLHGRAKGWHAGRDETERPAQIGFPWTTAGLAWEVGVEPNGFDTHTALGDCRLNRAIWDAIHRVGE